MRRFYEAWDMLDSNSAVATAELQNNQNHILNFRMWFKFGLGASVPSGRVEPTCEISVKQFTKDLLVEICFLYEYINYNKQPINKDELIKDFDWFNKSNIL